MYKNLLAASLLVVGVVSADAADNLLTRGLTLVDENHASLTINSVPYTLDTYIVLFQQPYYVLVSRADGQTMELEEAAKVAQEYIQPRGCTEPAARLPRLDMSSKDKSQWRIGINC